MLRDQYRYGFTAVVLVAYALVVEPRSWVPQRALLLEYGPSVFSRVQIVLSFCVLAALLGPWRRWVGAFAVVFLLGFTAELVGVRTGLPFGRYRFTEMLGPKLLGTVPLVMGHLYPFWVWESPGAYYGIPSRTSPAGPLLSAWS